MVNGAISIGFNMDLNIILVKYMAHAGLALATSIATTIATILLFYGLKKKIGSLGTKAYLTTFFKTGLASGIMGLVEYFPEGDYEWAYFRIVTDDLPSTNVYENLSYNHEELTELSPGNYVERSVWDDNEFNGEPLPSNARVVSRILKGDLVIFNKASLYNSNSSTYDGRHSEYGIEGFRQHIKDVILYIAEQEKE